MLLVKVISTPYPPRNEPPENVICGPGLLLQSYAEKSAEMETGIGRVVLLMCGNDDDDAANDGDVMGAFDDPSVHAPACQVAVAPGALRRHARVSPTTRSRTRHRTAGTAGSARSRPPGCARSSSGRRRISHPRRSGPLRRACDARATTWGGGAAGSAGRPAGRATDGC